MKESKVLVNSNMQNTIGENGAPVSRTYQYRKIMKPLLERKRRARINSCLDNLKELMVLALQAEGENVAKLEKADILEHTVRYLYKLRKQNNLMIANLDNDRFRAGYTKCAREVSKCLAITPGIDIENGTKLMTHLGHKLNEMIHQQQDNILSPNPSLEETNFPPSNPFLTPPLMSPSECNSSSHSTYTVNSTIISNKDDCWHQVPDKNTTSVWRPW